MQTAVARFLQYLRVERNASDLTIKSYREDLEALVEYLGDSQAAAPRAGPGEHCRAARLRGCAARSRLRQDARSPGDWPRCAAFFASASARAGRRPIRPSRCATRENRASLPHFLSSDDDRAPAAGRAGKDDPQGLRDRAILEVLYSAGLRVSELAGLNSADLDFSGGTVRVRGKGRRERIAPIGSYAVRALNEWLAVRRVSPREKNGADAPVFVNKFGRRLTTRSVGRMLEKHLALRGWTDARRRTRCGTASPRTCSIAAPTSAACKNCWVTKAW